MCIVCHTPHGSIAAAAIPLWNHAITTQVFTPYTSATMKAVVGQPDGASKLCLSCHDGTVAMDSFNGVVGTTKLTGVIGPNLLTGQGHWKHPISITFDTALSVADTRMNNPAIKITALGGTVQKDLLFSNKVQCNSCHDVHNVKGLPKYLRIVESTLCVTCHKTRL
jgi:predicted CXXCH cytochrome family protein